jgi:hypothetical protein
LTARIVSWEVLGVKPIRMQIQLRMLPAAAGLATLVWACLVTSASAQISPMIAAANTSAASLAAEIERNGACAGADPLADVRRRLLVEPMLSATEIGRALAMVSASPTVCAPIRAAAATLSEVYPGPDHSQQLAAEVAAALAASSAAGPVSATATADAVLEFSVEAPPRRLTKGRNQGS